MGWVVDKFIRDWIDYSPVECDRVIWITRPELSGRAKQVANGRVFLPGAGKKSGYLGQAKQAAALAEFAMQSEGAYGGPSVAVFFRDSDGTQASPDDHWEQFTEAVEAGFRAVGYRGGVPMIPKPKQEAWLLCAMKENPYQSCAALEAESGNDASEGSLKRKLAEAVGCDCSTDDMVEWFCSGRVDINNIDMPSFNRFKESLKLAVLRA